jgi:hypothetical protein
MFCCRPAWVAAAFLAVFLSREWSVRAHAGDLQGIKSFQFFVSGIEKPPSRACGLRADETKAAFLGPLAAAGLVVGPPSAGYWIALQVTTAERAPGICATFVDASVLQNTRYYHRAEKAERDGKVLLWTHGELVLSDLEGHGEVVRDVFEKLGARLVEAWRPAPSPEQLN